MARGGETPPGCEVDISISWVLPGYKLRLGVVTGTGALGTRLTSVTPFPHAHLHQALLGGWREGHLGAETQRWREERASSERDQVPSPRSQPGGGGRRPRPRLGAHLSMSPAKGGAGVGEGRKGR